MNNIGPIVQALLDKGQRVSRNTIEELKCNSWEWEALVPLLDDDAFLWMLERHVLRNCGWVNRPCVTYIEILQAVYVPELIKRFRQHAIARGSTSDLGLDYAPCPTATTKSKRP